MIELAYNLESFNPAFTAVLLKVKQIHCVHCVSGYDPGNQCHLRMVHQVLLSEYNAMHCIIQCHIFLLLYLPSTHAFQCFDAAFHVISVPGQACDAKMPRIACHCKVQCTVR